MTETPGVRLDTFGLRWAIKHSFLAYVARTAGGRAYVDHGATVTEDNELVFPPATEACTARGTWRFSGEVQFVAHGGLLHVRIADPTVRMSDDSGVLTVSTTDDAGNAVRVGLATFAFSESIDVDGVHVWHSDEVRLTAEGATVFNGVYQPGERLAPIRLRLPPAGAL